MRLVVDRVAVAEEPWRFRAPVRFTVLARFAELRLVLPACVVLRAFLAPREPVARLDRAAAVFFFAPGRAFARADFAPAAFRPVLRAAFFAGRAPLRVADVRPALLRLLAGVCFCRLLFFAVFLAMACSSVGSVWRV
ncbi:MAG: hypothetical protein H0X67_03985 [Acidobacteria bacterium]|nr:hypothetical protein [Acidobacteriota bacterium]